MRRSTQQTDGPFPVPGPPDDVARVVDAVHGLPGRPLPGVQAAALARALGGCLEATTVTIALWLPPAAGHDADGAAEHTVEEYRWPASDAGAAAPVTGATPVRLCDGEQVLADLVIEPPAAAERLRRWPELHAVTRLLVSDIQAQLITDSAERLIGQSTLLLADARLRAAGEMEHQRYQLERDLHDGAQHHMVALQMSLAMVEHQLDAGDAAEAGRHLDRLRELLASTEEVLHTTATGLLAPLADHGLVTALSARLDTLDTVTLDIDPELTGHRYRPEVEAAVYLACLEAVSNAHKHAPGAAVTLTLRTTSRGLSFEVADTGPGFDTEGRMPLRQLAARLASVDGTLTVRSSPTSGTWVSGFVAL
ncbi:Histidine kinase [Micromonospora pallida]|uniref:Histidine kinase n=1 Tax=Micromonospora pallida TaxID=145854 RepID=A0A1C6SIW4_9ACTN|nr:ATP-binding protein [Micromonospora pallida]SCL29426.1 Histidine kinase [Micromonospora pallida]